ncbi:MAG: hypothetical protein PHU42_03725 [Patescibacteria group bacterium]|nr:hypothetical protein [Patescibacteria group bacterium]
MIKFENKKSKIILTALSLVVLVGLVSGVVWTKKSGTGEIAKAESGQTQIGTQISATGNFNKIIYYDVVNNKWKNFNINETGSIPVFSYGYRVGYEGKLIYYVVNTGGVTDIKRIDISNLNNIPAPTSFTSAYKSLPNADPSKIIDVSFNKTDAAGYGTVFFQSDGYWYYINNADVWQSGATNFGRINCGTSTVKKAAVGAGLEVAALCDNGHIMTHSAANDKIWTDKGVPTINVVSYGYPNAIGIYFQHIALSTTAGYILHSDLNYGPDYESTFNQLAGHYIFETFTYDASGYTFTAALNSAKTNIGFFKWGTPSITPTESYTANCEVSKTSSYNSPVAGISKFIALVKDTCIPNCGNSIIESSDGEQCDLGAQNGVTGSTCSATCQTITVPPPSSCTDSSLTGYAWTENAGWIAMKGAGYGVSIDSSNGNLSGFAWSENIGWINFAPIGPYPDEPTNAAKMDATAGTISGWASILVNQNDTTTKGWIRMSGTGYGVKVDKTTGILSGYAWSEDYGWINFGGVTWGCIAEGISFNDGILVYTSAQREGATNGDASVTSGEKIVYSLELTNQGNAAKVVNLKFSLPYGYSFDPTTANITCTVGISPCGNPNSPIGTVTGNGTNKLLWNGINVPVGESKISFTLKAP